MKGRIRFVPGYCISFVKCFLLLCVIVLNIFEDVSSQPYKQHRCSSRLENALEHMRRRSAQVKTSRALTLPAPQSPYAIYHSIYGQHEADPNEDFYGSDRGYYAKNIYRNNRRPAALSSSLAESLATVANQRQPHKLTVSKVEVENLHVKLPSKPQARWVEIQACNFNRQNSTLDTRLIFPDLTISGKVVMHPTGGKCNMILRLRHAGIEFHTIPIGFDPAMNEQSRRIGSASVRTDSHFAEPGFISVFAHGCQGPSGIKLRQNSKRRFGYVGDQPFNPDIEFSEPQVVLGTTNTKRWGKLHNPFNSHYGIRNGVYARPIVRDHNLDLADAEADSREFYDPNEDNFYRNHYRSKRDLHRRQGRYVPEDQVNFTDDILNISDDLSELVEPDARAFASLFAEKGASGDDDAGVFNTAEDRDEVNEAFTNELERLFSMGVRSLLTTYMQRALQPAIKETLMENMGYTLSYGR